MESLRIDDHLPPAAVAAVVKVALDGTPTLIGTGFFIDANGLFVTAKHVITDNTRNNDPNGEDIGGIGALLLDKENFGTYLSFKFSCMPSPGDIALVETNTNVLGKTIKTSFLSISLTEPLPGTPIRSEFFCHPDEEIANESLVLSNSSDCFVKYGLEMAFFANGENTPQTSTGLATIEIGHQKRSGVLRGHHKPRRDSVMLDFPVFESDLALPGCASGGPVLNEAGLVIGVNTAGFSGSDIAYHTYTSELLPLYVPISAPGFEKGYVVQIDALALAGHLKIDGIHVDPTVGLGISPSP